VVFALTADVSAAKAKKRGAGVSGSIVSITPDSKDKDTGTIKIKVMAGKKKGAAAAAEGEEKTFKYNKDTKYFKSEGKSGEVAAVFSDLATGTNVTIAATGDTADKITIAGKKKKK